MDVKVDYIYNGQAEGQFAQMLLNNGKLDLGRMRPFVDKYGRTCMTVHRGGDPKKPENYKTIVVHAGGTLRRDEWKALDAAVIDPARYRLGGFDDLISRGLTYDLGNGLGTTVLEWHDVSEAGEAEMTMDGLTRARNDRPLFQHRYLPLPIVHADYEINTRELATSRNMGNPIDTTMAERASRRVREKLESLLFTDTSYSYGEKDSVNRNTIYSYLNYPDAGQYVIPIAWDDTGITGPKIVADVLAMKQISIEEKLHFGPWMLYIPVKWETVLDRDYVGQYPDTAPGTTIRQRIMAIDGIEGIKISDMMPADTIIFVQLSSNVVRIVRGMGIQNIQWSEEGGMVTKFKVMTIQVPQFRSDYYGKCGLVIGACASP